MSCVTISVTESYYPRKGYSKWDLKFKHDRAVKSMFLWIFGSNRSVTAIMKLTFLFDFQEQVQQLERYGQNEDSCLSTSQLLSALIATPNKYSEYKNETQKILQQLNAKKI